MLHSPHDCLFPELPHHPQQEFCVLMHNSLFLSIVPGDPHSISHLYDSAHSQKWNDTCCPLLSDLTHILFSELTYAVAYIKNSFLKA